MFETPYLKSLFTVEFALLITKFRQYSMFNNMLVYLQNPFVTFYATEKHWLEAFGRNIKLEARGMVILAPMTPVLIVYDGDETEGPPLPEKFESFISTSGNFDLNVLEKTIENCNRHGIHVDKKHLSRLYAGFATTWIREEKCKLRIVIHDKLMPSDMYSILCHEIGHILLGHLGSDEDHWWPSRIGLTKKAVEIEAEAVSYLVCSRSGIMTQAAGYLSSYIQKDDDIEQISLDMIIRVASRIEQWGKRFSEDKMKKKLQKENSLQ